MEANSRDLADPPKNEDERIVPLFPLPDVMLFPGLLQALHIFEPRYIAMIEDVLDGSGDIVLGTVLGASPQDLLGAPPVAPVAGIGRIEKYRRLEDGRYNLLLRGFARVFIEEIPSRSPYRLVNAKLVQESACSKEEEAKLRPELLRALSHLNDAPVELPDDLSISLLSDLLLVQLSLPPAEQHAIYSYPSVRQRALAILSAGTR